MTHSSGDEALRQLILDLSRFLVDESEEVTVDVCVEDETTTLTVHVAVTDAGKIIGRQGQTARSIRTLLNSIVVKLQKRYVLEIMVRSPIDGSSCLPTALLANIQWLSEKRLLCLLRFNAAHGAVCPTMFVAHA